MAEHPALDGLRVLFHLSVIVLHAVTDRSFHYNEDGPVQRGVLTSWMLSLTTMGGLQVDVFFVLSGFLLCRTMRKCSPQDARDGLKSFVLLRRFVRLATLPALYIAFMYLVGLNRLSVEQVADQLSLSMVYLNKRVTSELLPMWSNHADFYQQLVVGSALQLFIARIGRLAEHCEAASALLVGIALCGVALRQLQYSRGSSIMGGLNAYHCVNSGCYDAYANVTRRGLGATGGPRSDVQQNDFAFLVNLYAAPMARVMPMCFGAVVGLWHDADVQLSRPRVPIALCALTLATVLLPPITDTVRRWPALQWFVSVWANALFSACLAGLLFCLVSTRSNVALPAVRNALAWRGFKLPAEATFGSYVVHRRILRDLNAHWLVPAVDYDSMPHVADAVAAVYRDGVVLALCTAALSLPCGFAAARLVEKPVLALVNSVLFGVKPSAKAKAQ